MPGEFSAAVFGNFGFDYSDSVKIRKPVLFLSRLLMNVPNNKVNLSSLKKSLIIPILFICLFINVNPCIELSLYTMTVFSRSIFLIGLFKVFLETPCTMY